MCILVALICFLFWGVGHAKQTCDESSWGKPDSVKLRFPKLQEKRRLKMKETNFYTQHMATSSHPVTLEVKGSALLIISDYQQLLPIYTQGGSFYMAMRLNKGKNWLNGLPHGRYLINNKSVTIP